MKRHKPWEGGKVKKCRHASNIGWRMCVYWLIVCVCFVLYFVLGLGEESSYKIALLFFVSTFFIDIVRFISNRAELCWSGTAVFPHLSGALLIKNTCNYDLLEKCPNLVCFLQGLAFLVSSCSLCYETLRLSIGFLMVWMSRWNDW